MKDCLVSVVTINRNNLSGLRKTVASVLAQTYRPLEYIVIDGASGDGSAEWLLSQQSRLAHWESSPDRGIYHAMNKGLAQARGDYVLFLNSGDYLYEPHTIAHLLEGSAGEDLIYGNIGIYQNQKLRPLPSASRIHYAERYQHNLPPHPALLMKRSLIEQLGGFDESYAIVADVVLIARALGRARASYRHVPLLSTVFDQQGVSSSPRNQARILAERKRFLSEEFPHYLRDFERVARPSWGASLVSLLRPWRDLPFVAWGKSRIKRGLQWLLLQKNLRLTPATSMLELESFFASFAPVTSEHPLIRIGGDGDGGYLVPDDLEGLSACFSPGVSDIADFERELVARGVPCFLADYSVSGPPWEHPLVHFQKKFLGIGNDSTCLTLDSWVQEHAPVDSDLILQMDIEGAEYEVLLDVPAEVLRRFRILVIEFHLLDSLLHETGYRWIRSTFQKLTRDFEIVHIHPNSCVASVHYRSVQIPPVMEYTFLRKDRLSRKSRTRQFPHPLDRGNAPGQADLHLPPCWFDH